MHLVTAGHAPWLRATDYTRNVLGVSAGQFGLLQSLFAAGSIGGVLLIGQVGSLIPKGTSIFGVLTVLGLTALLFVARPGTPVVATSVAG